MLKKIRLELGRTPDRPEGDPNVAYEILAPLDRNGHLDAEAWKIHCTDCSVAHVRPGLPVEKGTLLHRAGNVLAFSYHPGPDDDKPLFKLTSHQFLLGELVSITGHNGAQQPYKVVSVTNA